MGQRTVVLSAILICCCTLNAAAENEPAEPYSVDEAYRIYSLLLPNEESYGFANGTLVIQEETVRQLQRNNVWPGPEACISPEVADQFKDAITDYNRVNLKRWSLQRQFQIARPYEVVSSDAISVLFKLGGWKAFNERYPVSGGIQTMSAVGFNKEKTRAIVYSGSSCGSLCGAWSFHLLEKVNGEWREIPGVTCHTVS